MALIGIKIKFGTKSRPNADGGCSGEKGICLIIGTSLATSGELGLNEGIADAVVLNQSGGSVLRWSIEADNSDNQPGESFHVRGQYTFPADVAAALGYDQVMLEPGVYPMDYTENPFGVALLPVTVAG